MLPPLSRISNLAALLNCRHDDGIPLRCLPGGRDSPFLLSHTSLKAQRRESEPLLLVASPGVNFDTVAKARFVTPNRRAASNSPGPRCRFATKQLE